MWKAFSRDSVGRVLVKYPRVFWQEDEEKSENSVKIINYCEMYIIEKISNMLWAPFWSCFSAAGVNEVIILF